ncbi:MAG: SRPBCC domain-containing protein, partial [Pricia sp.]
MKDLKNRTLTIKKTFNAPIKLVWDTWTQPEHVLKWWAPNGMDIKVIEHEFKVGGKWKYTMSMPDGTAFISEGTYKEIVPLKKIVTSADFRPMTEGVELQTFFEANGDKTKFTF